MAIKGSLVIDEYFSVIRQYIMDNATEDGIVLTRKDMHGILDIKTTTIFDKIVHWLSDDPEIIAAVIPKNMQQKNNKSRRPCRYRTVTAEEKLATKPAKDNFKNIPDSVFDYIYDKVKDLDYGLQWHLLNMINFLTFKADFKERSFHTSWFAISDRYIVTVLKLPVDVAQKYFELMIERKLIFSTTTFDSDNKDVVYKIILTPEDEKDALDRIEANNVSNNEIVYLGKRLRSKEERKMISRAGRMKEQSLLSISEAKQNMASVIDAYNNQNIVVDKVKGDRLIIGEKETTLPELFSLMGTVCESAAYVYSNFTEKQAKDAEAFASLTEEYSALLAENESLKLKLKDIKEISNATIKNKEELSKTITTSLERLTNSVMAELVDFNQKHTNILDDVNRLQNRIVALVLGTQTNISNTLK